MGTTQRAVTMRSTWFALPVMSGEFLVFFPKIFFFPTRQEFLRPSDESLVFGSSGSWGTAKPLTMTAKVVSHPGHLRPSTTAHHVIVVSSVVSPVVAIVVAVVGKGGDGRSGDGSATVSWSLLAEETHGLQVGQIVEDAEGRAVHLGVVDAEVREQGELCLLAV